MALSTLSQRDKTKLSILSGIISQELIRENGYGACLPAALIFCEQARKMGYNPRIAIGYCTHKILNVPVFHFAVNVEGEWYDPSRKVFQKYCGVNPEDFTFEEVADIEPMDDDQYLMKTYYEKFKETQSATDYFEEAPDILCKIRRAIYHRVKRTLMK